MATEIKDHNGPLENDVVNSLEQELSLKLPTSYRSFLTTYNGGYPEPDGFDFGTEKDSSSVDQFLGLDIGKHNNLRKYLDTYKNRIPPNLFPIAHDPGGNLILIGTDGEVSGKVLFWDHEQESDSGKPDMSNIYPIADSFEKFLKLLYKYEF